MDSLVCHLPGFSDSCTALTCLSVISVTRRNFLQINSYRFRLAPWTFCTFRRRMQPLPGGDYEIRKMDFRTDVALRTDHGRGSIAAFRANRDAGSVQLRRRKYSDSGG